MIHVDDLSPATTAFINSLSMQCGWLIAAASRAGRSGDLEDLVIEIAEELEAAGVIGDFTND